VLSTAMDMDISLISYLCIAWTFLVGGIDAYWLFTAPALPRLLYCRESMRLRWQDPASTPGVVLLVDGFGVSALLLLAGAAVIVLLAFWLPGFSNVTALKSVLDGFFVLLAYCVLGLGSTPISGFTRWSSVRNTECWMRWNQICLGQPDSSLR
jgi:hypothetical protein